MANLEHFFALILSHKVLYNYVTESAKTVLITQDRKFDFFTQTQSLKNVLSNFTVTVVQSKVVCFFWLLFSSTVASHTSGLES